MRRHHEEIVAASAIVPTVSVLIPITIAFWIRVKDWSRKPTIDDRQ